MSLKTHFPGILLAVIGSVKQWNLNSVFPVKERKILSFLLGTFVHGVPSLVPLVSDSTVWIMWSVPWSQLLFAHVFVHLQKTFIIYWITPHARCTLLPLHLIFAGVWSQPPPCSYTKPRAKSGSEHPLEWTQAVALKIYLTHSADARGLPSPSSQEAVSQKHLKNYGCVSRRRALLKSRNIAITAYKLRGSLLLLSPYQKEK